jgi:hypothetical protein
VSRHSTIDLILGEFVAMEVSINGWDKALIEGHAALFTQFTGRVIVVVAIHVGSPLVGEAEEDSFTRGEATYHERVQAIHLDLAIYCASTLA